MQSTLVTLALIVIVLAAVVGVVNQVSRSGMYDEIGKGGLSMDGHEADGPAGEDGNLGADAQRAERELEVRQMLAARNDRIARHGGEPPDLEAEVARLTGADTDT